jgi:C1A family cysteine protease
MFHTDEHGFVDVSGSIVGGHEYVCRGYNAEASYLFCDNSWGTDWGLAGSFKLRLPDWETLRVQQADVTVPHA